jgi:hypothetical protein
MDQNPQRPASIGNPDLTILEMIKKPSQSMILAWNTPMKDFFLLYPNCDMPTLFVNI